MLSSKVPMRPFGLLAAWAAILSLSPLAAAWNLTGHRIIAAIAYDRLTPGVRARVDELLQRHPDYATLLTSGASDPESRARAAFIAAAAWPDVIKGDPRFYDSLRKDAHPTPLLPGFPDMARHTNWHYYDVPYPPDGALPQPPRSPNALDQIERLLGEIDSPASAVVNLSYDLPWLEHLEGDLHQPLHCITRFLKSQPDGDAGGNFVFVTPGNNLHALWDDLTGPDTSYANVTKTAAQIVAEYPPPKYPDLDPPDLNPEAWLNEGVRIAISQVYTFGLETGSRESPIRLAQIYQENARRVARSRIALSGYRLAAVLNEKLR